MVPLNPPTDLTDVATPAAANKAVLSAEYFDGVSARAYLVSLHLDAKTLHIQGQGMDLSLPRCDVMWPERTRYGARVAHFKDGGSVHCQDSAAWDAWWRAGGQGDSWVVRMQQSWRWVLACVLAMVAVAVSMQQWGFPLAARAVVALTPHSVDAALGESVLPFLDQHVMRPSKLPKEEQDRYRTALARALLAEQKISGEAALPWTLLFRQSAIGPNALALPGGPIIMTDELVQLVGRDEQVITAVLAHEISHVRRRHGLRMLVQVTLLSGLAALVLGDFSSVLAGAPVILGHASYSREAEREADQDAVTTLKAAGISPAVMISMFEKLDEYRRARGEEKDKPTAPSKQAPKRDSKAEGRDGDEGSWLGIAFASHPSDAERIRFFRDAAAVR